MRELALQSQSLREAWEQGLQEGLTQVALNMLQEGIDLSLVAKLTNSNSHFEKNKIKFS